jgi:hypothetical protein
VASSILDWERRHLEIESVRNNIAVAFMNRFGGQVARPSWYSTQHAQHAHHTHHIRSPQVSPPSFVFFCLNTLPTHNPVTPSFYPLSAHSPLPPPPPLVSALLRLASPCFALLRLASPCRYEFNGICAPKAKSAKEKKRERKYLQMHGSMFGYAGVGEQA